MLGSCDRAAARGLASRPFITTCAPAAALNAAGPSRALLPSGASRAPRLSRRFRAHGPGNRCERRSARGPPSGDAPRATTSGLRRAVSLACGRPRVHDGRARPLSAMPTRSSATPGTLHSPTLELPCACGAGVTRRSVARSPTSGRAPAAHPGPRTWRPRAGAGRVRQHCDVVTAASAALGRYSVQFRRTSCRPNQGERNGDH